MVNTESIRDSIILETLNDVPFDGWSMEVVTKAAERAGHDDLTLRAAFPKGLTDALDAFADLADRHMLEALNDQNPDDMRIRDRVRAGIMARFTVLAPHKEAVKLSLKHWLHPLRKARAAKITWRTADRIWNWAGDTATDYNRFTKRGLLSGILAPAMLVWLNDDDPEAAKTQRFVDARIDNVMQLGKLTAKIKA